MIILGVIHLKGLPGSPSNKLNLEEITELAQNDIDNLSKAGVNGIIVENFRCTKVMSKIVRTYTDSHGLKNLCEELLSIEISKQQQQTNWASPNLTQSQLEYAASDVYHLIDIYHQLESMMRYRPSLPSGKTIIEINDIAQKILPGLIQILIHGYGDRDQGWETSLFTH